MKKQQQSKIHHSNKEIHVLCTFMNFHCIFYIIAECIIEKEREKNSVRNAWNLKKLEQKETQRCLRFMDTTWELVKMRRNVRKMYTNFHNNHNQSTTIWWNICTEKKPKPERRAIVKRSPFLFLFYVSLSFHSMFHVNCIAHELFLLD